MDTEFYLPGDDRAYLVTIENSEIIDIAPQKTKVEMVVEFKRIFEEDFPKVPKIKPVNNFPGRKSLKSLQRIGK